MLAGDEPYEGCPSFVAVLGRRGLSLNMSLSPFRDNFPFLPNSFGLQVFASDRRKAPSGRQELMERRSKRFGQLKFPYESSAGGQWSGKWFEAGSELPRRRYAVQSLPAMKLTQEDEESNKPKT